MMKKKSAAKLLIVFLMLSVLGSIVSDIHNSGMEFSVHHVPERAVVKDTPTISENLPVDHHVSVVKPKSLAGSLFFAAAGKRNNALFIKNIVEKALLALFTAFFSGTGKCFAMILLACLAFTGMLMARIRILHQTDGKKRFFFCLEIPQKVNL